MNTINNGAAVLEVNKFELEIEIVSLLLNMKQHLISRMFEFK